MSKRARLRRLCDLRRIEELNQAAQLEQARSELQRVEQALREAEVRKSAGRGLFNQGAGSGDLDDRIAGLEEIASATRLTGFLRALRSSAENLVRRTEAEYLLKRAQRSQVETLLRLESEREAAAAQKQNQSLLDEWHRSRRGPIEGAADEEYSIEMDKDREAGAGLVNVRPKSGEPISI